MLKVAFFVILVLTIIALSGTKNDEGPLFRSIYLTLANKTHKLPDNWEDKIQLDAVQNFFGEEIQIERKTHEHFQLLREELVGHLNIGIDTAYHSARSVQQSWDDNIKRYGKAVVEKHFEAPGCSDHQTGLALNICVIKGTKVMKFGHEDKEALAKIHKLLPKYGFILRYPIGKENITGHSYEPLHLRYIDSPKIAKKIAKKDLTLEEYLGEY